ncbi:hypothetical protein J6590_099357 [Homalodisca vitripennis]|nr:hypothetical protein J6590_099357 [Homalodisca vitripennis]
MAVGSDFITLPQMFERNDDASETAVESDLDRNKNKLSIAACSSDPSRGRKSKQMSTV